MFSNFPRRNRMLAHIPKFARTRCSIILWYTIFQLSWNFYSKFALLLKSFELVSQLHAVYDVTIAYKNQCPSFLDNVFGVDPSEVHLHIRRIPVEEIPASEAKADSWLMNTFEIKDQLLSDFKDEGHFPNQVNEKELSTFKGLLTFTMVVGFTAMFTYFTFFSLIWFKLYVGLSCAYLSIATNYKFQMMPLTNYVHALYNSKKQEWIGFSVLNVSIQFWSWSWYWSAHYFVVNLIFIVLLKRHQEIKGINFTSGILL